MNHFNRLKVAIVHDWFSQCGGAERVIKQMLYCFPQADVFALVDFLDEGQRDFLQSKPVTTSFIQKLPFAKSKYRNYLLLMPLVIEQFDLSEYDLVLSSSSAIAKGVITGPDQLHLSYVYTPMRYAWDLQHQYLRETNLQKGLKSLIARYVLHKMRIWDSRTANNVDEFIAVSNFIARRIHKIYRRKAVVINPPINIHQFTLRENKEDFYVTLSRLVSYKRIDILVRAFAQMPDKPLFIIGDGPELSNLQQLATGNITFLGYQSDESACDYLQRAKAFLFSAEEDFGLVPLEAQACGTPVIAYGKGGALETVLGLESHQPTGLFFHEQTPQAVIDAVKKFEGLTIFKPHYCRQHAIQFSEERFREQLMSFVEQTVIQFYAP